MSDTSSKPGKIGIVLNPMSGRVRRDLEHFRQLANRIPCAQTIEAITPQQINEAVIAFGLQPHDLLVIVGGDGSLQAALTAVMTVQPLAIPQVLVVPAGTTNMSAADLGSALGPAASLAALGDWMSGNSSAPPAPSRPVLKVLDSESQEAQYGFFFGAGAVVSGVRYFHSSVRPKGIRGALGPSLAFLRMLLSLFRRGPHPLLPATPARLHLGANRPDGDWLLILATTLDKLLLGSTPYWGPERAPMHFTAIAHQPPRLLATLPWLLRGKRNRTIQQHEAYVSHNLAHTAIEELKEYLLDGEIFAAQGRLHLSATTHIRFISL
jgi:hypothetical protein